MARSGAVVLHCLLRSCAATPSCTAVSAGAYLEHERGGNEPGESGPLMVSRLYRFTFQPGHADFWL